MLPRDAEELPSSACGSDTDCLLEGGETIASSSSKGSALKLSQKRRASRQLQDPDQNFLHERSLLQPYGFA
jgi:hypothetical protein